MSGIGGARFAAVLCVSAANNGLPFCSLNGRCGGFAAVLADMLKENYTMENINLDHNPIGQRGGRAMLRAIRQVMIGSLLCTFDRECLDVD